jgi:putative Mn2+ efflux pump MntP
MYTFAESPLSTSIPAFSVGVPVALLFKVIMLSASKIVSVFTVVTVPFTVHNGDLVSINIVRMDATQISEIILRGTIPL